MSRHLITLTYEYLARIHDHVAVHAETLPNGSRRKLAKDLEELFAFAKQDYFGQIDGQSEEQVEFLSRLFMDSADQLVRFFFPLFDSPEVPAVLNHLTLPMLRYSPPNSQCVALVPSTDEVNFGTQMFRLTWAWNVLASNTNVAERNLDQTLNYFISYPQPLGNDLLSLTVFGHEVAHVWFSSCEGGQKLSELIGTLDPAALAAAALTLNLGPNSIEESDYFFEVQQKALKWAEEIVCDIVAIHLLGPAVLFAFERTIQLSGGHKGATDFGRRDNTHPDSRWRCRIMLEQLRDNGFPFEVGEDAVLRGVLGELHFLAKRDMSHEPTFADQGDAVIYRAIESARANLMARLVAEMQIPALRFATVIEQVPPIASEYEIGHIVSDRWEADGSVPLHTSAILLALWEVYLRQKNDDTVHPQELRSYEVNLSAQVAKSMSSAETLHYWRT